MCLLFVTIYLNLVENYIQDSGCKELAKIELESLKELDLGNLSTTQVLTGFKKRDAGIYPRPDGLSSTSSIYVPHV